MDLGLDSAHLGSARGFILSSVCFGSALARGSTRMGLVRNIDLLTSHKSESTYTRGVQKVRGPTKKENDFYDEARCEGCDLIKTTPDAATGQSVLLLCSGCWLLYKCLLFL